MVGRLRFVKKISKRYIKIGNYIQYLELHYAHFIKNKIKNQTSRSGVIAIFKFDETGKTGFHVHFYTPFVPVRAGKNVKPSLEPRNWILNLPQKPILPSAVQKR